jgi:hypothetical protein
VSLCLLEKPPSKFGRSVAVVVVREQQIMTVLLEVAVALVVWFIKHSR